MTKPSAATPAQRPDCRCGHDFYRHDRQYGCAEDGCDCHGYAPTVSAPDVAALIADLRQCTQDANRAWVEHICECAAVRLSAPAGEAPTREDHSHILAALGPLAEWAKEQQALAQQRGERIAELEKDAARYRWLRDECTDADIRAGLGWAGQDDGLDAAIDAALNPATDKDANG